MRRTKSYKQHLLERLQTPEDVAGYVNAAMEERDMPTLLLALRDAADAQGLGKVAERAELNRQNAYKMLSAKGNPTLDSLLSVLFVLGLELRVEPVKEDRVAVATVSPTLVDTEEEPEQFQPVPDDDKGMNYESVANSNTLSLAA